MIINWTLLFLESKNSTLLTLRKMHLQYLLPPQTVVRCPAPGLNEDSLCHVWPRGLHPKQRTEEGIQSMRALLTA